VGLLHTPDPIFRQCGTAVKDKKGSHKTKRQTKSTAVTPFLSEMLSKIFNELSNIQEK
jgi:hypothetical protein